MHMVLLAVLSLPWEKEFRSHFQVNRVVFWRSRVESQPPSCCSLIVQGMILDVLLQPGCPFPTWMLY